MYLGTRWVGTWEPIYLKIPASRATCLPKSREHFRHLRLPCYFRLSRPFFFAAKLVHTFSCFLAWLAWIASRDSRRADGLEMESRASAD